MLQYSKRDTEVILSCIMRGAYPWDLYHVKCRVYPVDADRNHQMFPLSAGGPHQLDCHH